MVRLLREAQRALNSAAACRPLEAFWMQVPGDSCKQQHNNSHQQHSQAMNYPTIACWLCCWCLLVQGMHSDVTALSKASIWREASRGNGTADLAVHFIGGGMAGITAASATYPLDLVRTRLAAQLLLNLAEKHNILQRPNDSTVMASLACGSLSGIANPQQILLGYNAMRTTTFPLDLVRRRMQLEGSGGRARVYKTGLFGAFAHIIQTEGLRGMYRGILPEYYKVVPGAISCKDEMFGELGLQPEGINLRREIVMKYNECEIMTGQVVLGPQTYFPVFAQTRVTMWDPEDNFEVLEIRQNIIRPGNGLDAIPRDIRLKLQMLLSFGRHVKQLRASCYLH
ncbi:hypothetical protein NC652_016160 [Populus alba x Populus x berolinensis]|nr:hypothetical protein NC652_016160 [Populus alba x Populus x berolinensis]